MINLVKFPLRLVYKLIGIFFDLSSDFRAIRYCETCHKNVKMEKQPKMLNGRLGHIWYCPHCKKNVFDKEERTK